MTKEFKIQHYEKEFSFLVELDATDYSSQILSIVSPEGIELVDDDPISALEWMDDLAGAEFGTDITKINRIAWEA